MKEKKTRQLAAVMFTDIEGYTALMQGDEQQAMKVRERHREVFEAQHEVHQGKIIQYFGDGTLSMFQSGVNAVECAVDIQQAFAEGEPVPLRIGLHTGDIVFDGTDIYGDAVNLASRIESFGVAGAILLSSTLNEELKNHSHIQTQTLGYFDLKNISKPVEIFAVIGKGIKIPGKLEMKGKGKLQAKSIAVLPFVNMSPSQENEYFSDGITEEIINALSKIKSLKVTSRTSSFFFKNKNIPLRQIGRELNVSAILEGSVRLGGNMIRITAQLIEAEEDFHFWSHTWDRKLENIFDIQDEISLEIAGKLREQFGHFEIQEHLVNKQTNDLQAYELSLKAKFHFNKWNPTDMHTAIDLYGQALSLDPRHAESYVGLADCYSFMATTAFMPMEEAWGKAAEFTHKAKELNDKLPGAYYQLANLSFFVDCDYKASYEHTIHALKINSNYLEARQFLSFLHAIAGEKAKSLQQLEIALGIDPISQETLFFQTYYHYKFGNYSHSLDLLNKCLEQNPKNIPAHITKCYCLLKLGRYNEARQYFDKLPPELVIPGDKLGITALAFAFEQNLKEADKYLEQIVQESKKPEGFHAQGYLYLMYAALKKNNEAFAWVERTMKNKSTLLLLYFSDPLADNIKADPRFKEFSKLLFAKKPLAIKAEKKKELLDEKKAAKYSDRLTDHMNENRPYLDQDLSLRTLAEQIEIHPNQLSWLLNQNFGKNFNEFVNHYRVKEFQKLADNADNSNLTLLAMAYDSGFNSKTAFNTYFKKEMGVTPREYMANKKLQESNSK